MKGLGALRTGGACWQDKAAQCVSRPLHRPVVHVQRPRRMQLARAQMDDSNSHTTHQASQRVFMMNPNNPGSVEEMLISPHEEIDAAEELIAIAQKEMKAVEEASGRTGRMNAPMPQRSPIPLRQVSPMPSRGGLKGGMAARLPGAPFMSQSRSASDGALSVQTPEEILSQLQRDQSQIAHLAQYEVMYREWRMKAERLDSDISQLQRLVAEKDAELAHGYKLLESSAAERSRLRHSYQAAQEKTKNLQHQLAEAEARALTAVPAPPLIGGTFNGSSRPRALGNGHANGNGQPLGNMQGMIEELSAMAQLMASEMAQEVRTMSSPGRE